MRRFLVPALLVLLAAPAAASTVLRVTLSDLVDRASAIVSGEVVAVEERLEAGPGDGTPYTFVTLRVEERWKGGGGPTHVLRLLGGTTARGKLVVPGIPSFAVGERVVLFDREDGSACSLVGLWQGVFRLTRGPLGERLLQDRTQLDGLDGLGGVDARPRAAALPAPASQPRATLGRVSSAPAALQLPGAASPGLAQLREAVVARLVAGWSPP